MRAASGRRTQLILDIFAQRARKPPGGRWQMELAQLQISLLPRLTPSMASLVPADWRMARVARANTIEGLIAGASSSE